MSVTSTSYEKIAIEALSLPTQERRELLIRLTQSLDEAAFDDAENLQIATERLERIRNGQSELIPYEIVRERVRTKYGI